MTSGDRLYRIRYCDGDLEHFTADQVREMQYFPAIQLPFDYELRRGEPHGGEAGARGVGASFLAPLPGSWSRGALRRGEPHGGEAGARGAGASLLAPPSPRGLRPPRGRRPPRQSQARPCQ